MSDLTYCYLNWGVARIFGSGDIGSTGLVFGWSTPEEGHTWNDGTEALAEFRAPYTGRAGLLTVECAPFLREGLRRQSVSLHINGFLLGSWGLHDDRGHLVSVVIEPEQMFRRHDDVFLKCRWSMPNSYRPSDGGAGGDSRQLGLCFRSITLSEVD